MTLHAISKRNPELSILILAAISGILFVLITALQRAVHRTPPTRAGRPAIT